MNYWLAVIGNSDQMDSKDKEPWWCVPREAQKDDHIFMYHPRSFSKSNHGVFALCSIKTQPDSHSEKNHRCSGYGEILSKRGLRYVELSIVKRYKNSLTAKDMKNDIYLRNSYFMRRNFQGTIFLIDAEAYSRINLNLEKKN